MARTSDAPAPELLRSVLIVLETGFASKPDQFGQENLISRNATSESHSAKRARPVRRGRKCKDTQTLDQLRRPGPRRFAGGARTLRVHDESVPKRGRSVKEQIAAAVAGAMR